jgi:hypothetical protein
MDVISHSLSLTLSLFLAHSMGLRTRKISDWQTLDRLFVRVGLLSDGSLPRGSSAEEDAEEPITFTG